MKPTIFLLSLSLLLSLLAVGVSGIECGTVPVEDCTLNADTTYTFDPGVYLLNDSNANGAIIVNGNNVVLDCNGAELRGNGTDDSRAIMLNSGKNSTIRNCIINNYDRGVKYNSGTDNSYVSNLTFYGNDTIASWGVDVYSRQNVTVSDSIFWYGARGVSGESGIGLIVNSSFFYNQTAEAVFSDSLNTTVLDNYFQGNATDTCEFYLKANFSIAKNNIFNISGNTGLRVWSHNNSLYDNIFYNSDKSRSIRNSGYHNLFYNNSIYGGWNGFDEAGFYTIFRDSIIKGISHSGLDLWDDPVFRGQPANGTYYNIIIQDSVTEWGENLAGIYGGYTSGNRFYNITIRNLTANNGSVEVSGIKIDGNSSMTFDNLFYNITIQDIKGNASRTWCAQFSGTTTNFTENILDNCGRAYSLQNWYQGVQTGSVYNIYNNEFLNFLDVEYWVERPMYWLDFIINETYDVYGKVNMSNNGIVYFQYYGNKNFLVENNSITINSIPYSYFSIFNGTHSTPHATEANAMPINVSMGAGERALVLAYVEADDPRVETMATTITDYSMTYVEDTSLTIICTGTGEHNISQLSELAGYLGNWQLFHDGVYVGTYQGTTLSLSTCSTWEIIPLREGSTLPLLDNGERTLLFLIPVLMGVGALYMFMNGNLGMMSILIFLGLTLAIMIIRTIF